MTPCDDPFETNGMWSTIETKDKYLTDIIAFNYLIQCTRKEEAKYSYFILIVIKKIPYV